MFFKSPPKKKHNPTQQFPLFSAQALILWCFPTIWVFPKIGVPPKSSILIRFSIIFTIHFGDTPIFGNSHFERPHCKNEPNNFISEEYLTRVMDVPAEVGISNGRILKDLERNKGCRACPSGNTSYHYLLNGMILRVGGGSKPSNVLCYVTFRRPAIYWYLWARHWI